MRNGYLNPRLLDPESTQSFMVNLLYLWENIPPYLLHCKICGPGSFFEKEKNNPSFPFSYSGRSLAQITGVW